jgi:hypothetical protein
MIWMQRNYCIFKMIMDISMKQFENRKESRQVSVGNTDYYTSAASGAPITIKGKWRLK